MGTIEPGFRTFLSNSSEPFGSVRSTSTSKLIVSVANAGDFAIPRDAVKDVESSTVTFDCNKIDKVLRKAIEHANTHESL
jgi:hypothetical protein